MDKRILCITLILGLTSDEDRVVRSSAVRTLGVYVLYTCLREVCFWNSLLISLVLIDYLFAGLGQKIKFFVSQLV